MSPCEECGSVLGRDMEETHLFWHIRFDAVESAMNELASRLDTVEANISELDGRLAAVEARTARSAA